MHAVSDLPALILHSSFFFASATEVHGFSNESFLIFQNLLPSCLSFHQTDHRIYPSFSSCLHPSLEWALVEPPSTVSTSWRQVSWLEVLRLHGSFLRLCPPSWLEKELEGSVRSRVPVKNVVWLVKDAFSPQGDNCGKENQEEGERKVVRFGRQEYKGVRA